MTNSTAEKVDRLEEMMMELAYQHTKTEIELRSLSKEMKDFKRQMLISKKENNQRWSDLANKLGTLVEDIVAPSLPRIVKEDFGFSEIDRVMINNRIRDKKLGTVAELDVLILSGETLFVNETKSTPRMQYIDDFIDNLERLPELLPEYADKKVVPMFASLQIPDNVLAYLTKKKIYAVGMGEDVMEVLNLKDFARE